MFPQGTTFAALDDIDRCILFLAQGQSDAEVEPLDERNFHVAAWHEDLLDLADRYLLQGIHRITELTWRINHDRALAGLDPVRSSAEGMAKGAPKFFYELPDGTFREAPSPSADKYDDDELDWATTDKVVTLTDVGWRTLDEFLGGRLEITPALASRVQPMLARGHYDTVIRDIGAALETSMRSYVGSRSYGTRLIEEFISHLRASGRFIDAQLKILRIELLTASQV